MTTSSSDPLIGRLIDGRYQVRSRIARGGMATVYLATDLRLERRVAIKVMHGHLADDSQYKARFIQEARSAARLAHPNVVNVYDQGQDGETAYLVMEYLPGITLRDLLMEHKVLTTMQAIDIMEAILSGLAAAHKNGIVHRDLKPENVLLADDGRIKIGDFGLARAASANTATGNALLGTIAYLSPELVTRGVADTRSDIYAVGIMLYEMLAGEQPFKGEQAFQIAHQHANDTVPTPSTKNPRVPAELDELVLWATARDPDQRPRDAKAMLDQLHETEALLRLDEPATAATALQRTMIMPSAVASPSSTGDTQILTPKVRHRTGPILTETANTLALKSDRRRRKGFWLFALVILIAAVVGGTGWYFGTGPGAQIAIPNLAGQTPAAASAALTRLGFTVNSKNGATPSLTVAKDAVAETTPAIGTRVAKNSKVTLLISTGPRNIAVPTLVGEAQNAAIQKIKDAGFRYESNGSTKQFDAKVSKDTVISAFGTNALDLATVKTYGENQPISLVVSAGAIPDVAGLSVADATQKLKDVNITATSGRNTFSDTISAGNVIGIELADGQVVRPGNSLPLTVSKGKEQIAVPDIKGTSWTTAKKALMDLGFVIAFKNDSSKAIVATGLGDFATVSSVSPSGSTQVDKGSTVTVGLSIG